MHKSIIRPHGGRARRAGLMFVSLVTCALAGRDGLAGGSCLLASAANVPGDIAYRQRGTRCEGVYSVPVSGEIAVSVIGFHAGGPTFSVDGPGTVPITIHGQASQSSNLALRIMARDPRVQYQMDTTQVDATGSYRWDTAIVRDPRLQLGPDAIAAIACDNGCRHDNITRFFPVRIGTHPSGEMLLVLRSTAPLSRLLFTAVNGGKDVVRRKPVSGEIIGGTAVVLSLQGLLLPGDNTVTLVGESPDGPNVSWWGHLVLPAP